VRQFERQRFFRHRETETTSIHLVDVLTDRMTVDKAYRLPNRDPGTYKTLFKEVEIVPAMEAVNEEEWRLMRMPIATQEFGPATWTARLEDFIWQNWAPDKFHLVFHSSGQDSRVLGMAIKVLHERMGDDWLGDVLFASYAEGEGFRRLMAIEGWPQSQWASYDDAGPLLDRGLDLEHMGEGLNGPLLGANNQNWEFVSWLQHEGKAPQDDSQIQVWSGYSERLVGACHPKGNRLHKEHRFIYESAMSISRSKGSETAYPFESYDFLRAIIQSSYRLNSNPPDGPNRFMRKMAQYRSDELADVPRTPKYLPQLSATRGEQMVRDYRASWYGCEVHPRAANHATRNVATYSPWWAHYTAAAFCEYLRREGYELRAE